MKKNSLLKAIIVVFLTYFVLSWIIPVGVYNNNEFISGNATPVGILDLLIYPIITATSSVFILKAIIALLIGGLYGVLNKTGAYSNIVENLSKKFKGSEVKFLVITTLTFVLLSSITGLTLPIFVLVPFFATVLLQLGYRKIDAMLATIGAMLVGNMASLYGNNVAGYVSFLTNDINNSILIRIILLVLACFVLMFTLLKTSNINTRKKEEFVLYEKNVSKNKKAVGLVIISVISFILVMVGMYNWSNFLKIELFNDIHNAVTSFEIGGYPLFKNLIGSIPALGTWTNYELGIVLIIVSFIIGKIYGLKLSEIIDAFVEGIKKMIPVALFTIAASIIFLLMNSNSEGYTMFNFIANKLLGLTKGLNAFTMGLTSLIGSVFYNDFPYMLSSLYAPITSLYKDYALIGIITQSVHGLVQIIVPTSTLLVAGLTLFDIEYTEWLKKLIKFFIGLLLVIVLVIVIMILV